MDDGATLYKGIVLYRRGGKKGLGGNWPFDGNKIGFIFMLT